MVHADSRVMAPPNLARLAPQTFRLISRTTTTGWWDFEHGELWLGTDALLRRRRGWLQTVASVGVVQDVLASATDPLMEQRFASDALNRILEQGGWWIPAEAIEAARLRAGLMVGRLWLDLGEDEPAKFLWVKSNLTYETLSETLTRWIGDRLILD